MTLAILSLSLCSLGIVLALLSVSFSLHRIAEQLVALNKKIPDEVHTAELYNQVEQVAWHAGRSFEQGRRTDR